MVMGHSLGEYGALVAAGALTFDAALEAVSARGREMASLTMDDNGAMAAVFGAARRDRADRRGGRRLRRHRQHQQHQPGRDRRRDRGGRARPSQAFRRPAYTAIRIPVSHAFHTSIVAPASEPLRQRWRRLERATARRCRSSPTSTGDFYPTGAGVDAQMLDLLGRQVASPVQFVKGLRTLYDAGRAGLRRSRAQEGAAGFAEDVLGEHDDVLALFTNHPKHGDVASFNAALCGLYAAGLGLGARRQPAEPAARRESAAPASRPPPPRPRDGTPASTTLDAP